MEEIKFEGIIHLDLTSILGLDMKSRVKGSVELPYTQTVTFDKQGFIKRGFCSCPVGENGDCKHIGILLLYCIDYQLLPFSPIFFFVQQEHSIE